MYPYIQKAVWIEDAVIVFGTGRNDFRSTIVNENLHFEQDDDGVRYEVEAIDFSKWLSENIKPDDYVVMKMDIEGAEYDVLERMIRDETYKLIDKYYVEFHEWCFADTKTYESRKKRIMRTIPGIIEWE